MATFLNHQNSIFGEILMIHDISISSTSDVWTEEIKASFRAESGQKEEEEQEATSQGSQHFNDKKIHIQNSFYYSLEIQDKSLIIINLPRLLRVKHSHKSPSWPAAGATGNFL